MKHDDTELDKLIKRALQHQALIPVSDDFFARMDRAITGDRMPVRRASWSTTMQQAAYMMLTLFAGLCIGTMLQTNTSYMNEQTNTNFIKYMMASYGGLL